MEHLPGQYLTFGLARREFAMDATRVRAILPAADLAPVEEPTLADPAFLAGFVRMHGAALPVIDLRAKLALRHASPGRHPCIVVVEAATAEGPRQAGFLVDRLSDVVQARARDFRNGKLRLGRPRQVLDADAVLRATPASVSP